MPSPPAITANITLALVEKETISPCEIRVTTEWMPSQSTKAPRTCLLTRTFGSHLGLGLCENFGTRTKIKLASLQSPDCRNFHGLVASKTLAVAKRRDRLVFIDLGGAPATPGAVNISQIREAGEFSLRTSLGCLAQRPQHPSLFPLGRVRPHFLLCALLFVAGIKLAVSSLP
jgi:hypothetical protein